MHVFRRLAVVSAALGLVLASSSAGIAGMAVIETAAGLKEHSDEAVKAAVVKAVETAARGAKAMGFSQLAVSGVRVLPEMVIVQVLATDTAAGEEDRDGDTQPSRSGEGPGGQERL